MFSARMIYTAARVSKVPGSIIMKSLTRILLLLAIVGPASAGTYTPDFERGRALYERHCQHCHTADIHSRPKQLPLTRDELAGIVDHFRRTENLGWTPEEIDDVVEYLNRTRYRFGQR
jgi:mono/diheme cytochrome c family protein